MFRNLTPVVRVLLYANIAVFVLELLTGYRLMIPFALWPLGGNLRYGTPPFEPWQLVTYAFLHGGFLHILGNMVALYFLGPDVEALLGPKRFTLYYFVCVIGAALTQLFVMSHLHPGPQATIGASGGIFGVLLLYGIAFPHRRLFLLFLPVPIAAWLFVTLYGLLELALGVFGTAQGIAHFAHLGGMAAGFVMIWYWGLLPRRHRPWR